ncbi:MAG: EAL domain-containing protein [Gammaproteobacteria bacterium]
MKPRLLASFVATLVVALGLPILYLAVHYVETVEDTARISASQAQSADEDTQQRRAADLAQAMAVFLSRRGDWSPGIAADLARMLPVESGAAAEVIAPDGQSLIRTAPRTDYPFTGEAMISIGPAAGARVIVELPRTQIGIRPEMLESDIGLRLRQLLRGAAAAAGGGLLIGLLFSLVILRRRTAAADAGAEADETSARSLDTAPGAAPESPSDQRHHAFIDSVLDRMEEAAMLLTPDLEIARANPATCRLLGYESHELHGQALSDLVSGDAGSMLGADLNLLEDGESALLSKSGQVVSVRFSSVTGVAGSPGMLLLRSITEDKLSKKRIQYLTRFDALTRVANRMQFQHKLQQAMARAQRNNVRLALLYLDLDRFKDVNDTFGHPVGDRSLEITSRRIVDAMDRGTLIGRLAGDEFAILIENLPLNDSLKPTLAATSRMLLDRIAREFYIEKRELIVTASIGIAICPNDADNVVDLIRNADAAMYHAKQAGGNTYGFYAPEMNADAVDRLMIKSELRRALERKEFEVRYQPRVDLRDGRVTGAEALLRWRHPKRGEVPPSVFIPMAEDSSLIFEIGAWVLDRVCRDYSKWQSRLAWPGRVSVNLSLQQLRQRDFVQRIENTFERHQLTPSCMEFEITESTLMKDGEATLRMLDRLYQLGLHLSIDDFGTGYSSLSALQHFPIGTLKIDQSFVQGADHEDEPATIVTTIISMGQNLKMDVVAEGVETQQQLDFLRSHGCHYGQGHLFGQPLSSEEYLQLLTEQQGGPPLHASLFA